MFDPSVFEKTRLARLDEAAIDTDPVRLDEETRRLEVLQSYGVVGTPPEPTFDDIASMASLMCSTPIALVSMVTEDRQWFKARVGMDVAETPREQAFCAHAIRNPTAIMEVQDASLDPRFKDNPLVVGEPGIRFYAGAPLLTPAGVALGTVCVIDRVPRQLTPAMATGLKALARQAGELLALRRANADLETLNQSVLEMQMELEHYQVKLETENNDLAQANRTDPTTGLHNERAFEQSLAEELHRVVRNQSRLALLFIAVDQFQAFANDFGKVAAQDTLRRVAKALKAQARDYDTLAFQEPSRFAVLVPGSEDGEIAVVAERLRRAVAHLPVVGRGLRVSIGWTEANPSDAPLDLALRATSALERAVAAGGNQVQLADG